MKIITKLSALIILIAIAFFSNITAFAETVPTDGAAVIANDEEFVPLFTTSPDSTLKNHSADGAKIANPPLFYTQTTFLALLAGYLILIKIKVIPHGEKMHRRKIRS